MNDCFGREIKIGDYVAFSTSSKYNGGLKAGRVLRLFPETRKISIVTNSSSWRQTEARISVINGGRDAVIIGPPNCIPIIPIEILKVIDEKWTKSLSKS